MTSGPLSTSLTVGCWASRCTTLHTPYSCLACPSRQPPNSPTHWQTRTELPGVNGASGATAPFAERWAVRTGHRSTVITRMRMHRLRQLKRPQRVAGHPGLASAREDVDLGAEWLAAFHWESTPHAPAEDGRSFAARRGAANHRRPDPCPARRRRPGQHGWCERPGRGGRPESDRFYTPAPFRRQGYGAAIVAQATASATSDGARHVALHRPLEPDKPEASRTDPQQRRRRGRAEPDAA